MDNFSWWCAQEKESKYVDERLDELSNIKITHSAIDKIDKKATLSFIMPLEKGYFFIPENAIYKVYPSWGIFPDASNEEQKYVRGETRTGKSIDLDWFYVPMDYFPDKSSKAPLTHDFIITNDLRGPLFQTSFFQDEMVNLLILMYISSLVYGFGIPTYLLIGGFISVYNFWSVTYALY